jgi:hypothetical protein
MSYEVSIGQFDENVTYNGQPVFAAIIPSGLWGLHGMTGKQAASCITDGIVQNWVHPSNNAKRQHVLSKVKPWRHDYPYLTADRALDFLTRLREACLAHPRHKVTIF